MTTYHAFHVADYVIFVLTIVISLGIGLFYALSGGRQRTTSEFLVGNRKMAVLPVAISLMVSFESSIMMLGVPAETYTYGIQWIMANFGFFLANMAAIKIMVPLIHPLKITSAYEYLELRFKSRAVRLLGTFLGIVNYVCYMGIVLFGPAIALEAVTGFPLYSSVLVVAGASIIYTAIGGIKAVIWTDVFQSSVMFAGIFAILIKGTMVVGGVGKTWQIANDNGRLNFFVFDPNPMTRHTFWNLFVGSVIRGMALVFNQSSVQRISSTPTIKDAKKVMLLTAPAFLFTISFAVVEGIVAFAYYYTIRCDPLENKEIRDPNQIIPLMVMDIFEGLPGMPGLFLASLFSASLSTLSSGLSSLSALLWQDFVKPHTKPMSEFKATLIAKFAVVLFGTISVGIAFLVARIGGTLTQITGTILSSFGGPLTGLFFAGCFCPWVNAKGAITGCITGVAFVFWIAAGMTMSPGVKRTPRLPPAPIDQCAAANLMDGSDWLNFTTSRFPESTYFMSSTVADPVITAVEPEGLDRLYSISYMWLGLIGIFFTMFIASIVSYFTGYVTPEESNPMYLVSLMDELLPFLPERFRKWYRFGYSYDKTPYLNKKGDTLDDLKDPNFHNLTRFSLTVDTPDDKTNGEIALNMELRDDQVLENGEVSKITVDLDEGVGNTEGYRVSSGGGDRNTEEKLPEDQKEQPQTTTLCGENMLPGDEPDSGSTQNDEEQKLLTTDTVEEK